YRQREREQQRKRREINRLFSHEHLATITTQEIHLPSLEANIYLKNPVFEIDFAYEHPYIDGSGYKVLLDRNGLIKGNADD
ncbi:16945_t:CDS:2, partial [Racocetra fulgida]